jgi:hypothetical protein
VPEKVRETVEVVQVLIEEGAVHPSPKRVADRLGIGRSATYDRIKDSLRRGHLVNEAARHERGMKLVLGAELPAAGEDFLPSVEDIVRLLSAGPNGQRNEAGMRDRAVLSASPPSPQTPREADPTPIVGDDAYPRLLAEAVAAGHVARNESTVYNALSRLVRGNEFDIREQEGIVAALKLERGRLDNGTRQPLRETIDKRTRERIAREDAEQAERDAHLFGDEDER